MQILTKFPNPCTEKTFQNLKSNGKFHFNVVIQNDLSKKFRINSIYTCFYDTNLQSISDTKKYLLFIKVFELFLKDDVYSE